LGLILFTVVMFCSSQSLSPAFAKAAKPVREGLRSFRNRSWQWRKKIHIWHKSILRRIRCRWVFYIAIFIA